MHLSHPKNNDNKYTRGMVTVIGGCASYPGAAVLAGCAAYAASRAGSGYVTVFSAPENVALIQGYKPSLVVRPWSDIEQVESSLGASTPQRPRSYVIGPGFDAGDAYAEKLLRFVLAVDAPLVIDGGALSMLANEELCAELHERSISGKTTVLTPHMGEASKISQGFAIHSNEPEMLSAAIAKASGAICVLKGPVTYVSDVLCTRVMDTGTPALAKAGTGDVLAGIVGALLLHADNPLDAAFCASELHAFTARQCICETGDIALTPEDIIDKLVTSIKEYDEGR